jgi:dextranase
MTHAGGDNREYIFSGFPCTSYCRAKSVWCVVRESRQWKTVSFINLRGVSDDRWNTPKEDPIPVRDLVVSVEVMGAVQEVFLASPDASFGRPVSLTPSYEYGPHGMRAVVTVPELTTWALLGIKVET